jgi:predicted phosphoribosyltransferase
MATGLTMRAAILEIKGRHPARIVMAIPVAPAESVAELEPLVDEVVGLEISDRFLGSVGAYYSDFTQVSDDQVVDMLRMLDSGQ